MAVTILCGCKGAAAVCSCSKAMVSTVGSDVGVVLATRWLRGSALVLSVMGSRGGASSDYNTGRPIHSFNRSVWWLP
ncbi:hypothetical protein GBA52_016347 [Prunus armeniaca]|nr:hypothetical protein GBA52_016347 [Prunus armeniaca]